MSIRVEYSAHQWIPPIFKWALEPYVHHIHSFVLHIIVGRIVYFCVLRKCPSAGRLCILQQLCLSILFLSSFIIDERALQFLLLFFHFSKSIMAFVLSALSSAALWWNAALHTFPNKTQRLLLQIKALNTIRVNCVLYIRRRRKMKAKHEEITRTRRDWRGSLSTTWPTDIQDSLAAHWTALFVAIRLRLLVTTFPRLK